MANDVVTCTVFGLLCAFVLWFAASWFYKTTLLKKTAALAQANLELEQTLTALQNTQAHRGEFMAWIGHELRTPMNVMLGCNPLLREAFDARSEEAQMVDLIRNSTEQLLGVVNDMLDFAQLQAGRLQLQEDTFALDDALHELVTKLQPKAQAKGLSVVREPLPVDALHITADRQRLIQVLQHLLDNAIKFTDHGEVRLRVRTTQDVLRYEVEDTGAGIALSRHAEIFKNAGLGLSICDRLVRLQRGRMGIAHATCGGALFWFELPRKMAAHPTSTSTRALSSAKSWVDEPLKILLVDDHDLNLLVARNLLRKCFPQALVIEASRGAQALEILRAQEVDLALIDMLMPEMDGLQLTMALRRHFAPPVCHLPVLALTASNDPKDLGRCLSAGMDGVLLKPLNEKLVIAQISQAMTAAAERGQ